MLLLKEKEKGTKLIFNLYGICNMETKEFLNTVVVKNNNFLIGNFKYEQAIVGDFYSVELKKKLQLKNNFNKTDNEHDLLNNYEISNLIDLFLKPDKIIIPYNDLLSNKNLTPEIIYNYLKNTTSNFDSTFVIPNIITEIILSGKKEEKYELAIDINLKLL